MTPAEKVVKALREQAEFSRGIGDGSEKAVSRAVRWDALADFVEAAKATRDDVPACDCPPEGHYGMCNRQEAFDAALARLAEVLK